MAFTIELSHRAFDDIDSIVERVQSDSPIDATRWRRRLYEKFGTLQQFPRGCSPAPEDEYCDFEVRQTIFGNYRILFTIDDKNSRVLILTIRWAGRRTMSNQALKNASRQAGDRTD